MNEKFFDLKKEKQDRIINAALFVISEKGSVHGSTDEIVRHASISKGLLFHYFENKAELLDFLYDYSQRFVLLELRSEIREPSPSFFTLQHQLLNAEIHLLRQYPYMIFFLERIRTEQTSAAGTVTEQNRKYALRDFAGDLFKNCDRLPGLSRQDLTRLMEMIHFTKMGILRRHLTAESFHPDRYHSDVLSCLDILRKLTGSNL